MLLGELIVVALQSVRANLFRSILTMLGIIIGVASVIAMLAIGAGARGAVDQQIEALGAGLLSIRPGQVFQMGVAQQADNLSTDDVRALNEESTTLAAVVPERAGMDQLKLGNQNRNLRVVGATANFVTVQNYVLQVGRSFGPGDDAAKRAVVVVGSKVPAQFETTAEAIVGQALYIRGLAFTVIGVFEEKGTTGFRNVDEQVWIPLDTARFRLFGTKSLDLISAKPLRGVPMSRAIVDVERILRRQHQLPPGVDNDFTIQDPRQFLDFQQTAANIFAVLLAGIASISLVVGGIGIMNIMLVTVTERTREIGIRMALGASRMSIMAQFIIEAMLLCLLGGALGVLAGLGISRAITALAGWQATVSPGAIAMAFIFSASVGLFFGLWPAYKAARMDPIAALRYE
jgi:putative ABC transport system permease protein